MPTAPFRELGKIGVITDINSVDLPLGAVSNARNVRFADSRITNHLVWRSALASPGGGTPVFVFSVERSNDFDTLGYVGLNGSVYHLTNGSETDVTRAAYVLADSESQRTFCVLQGVYYVNQEDRVPWYYSSASTDYADLTNWTATHRCRVLRSFKDFLIALNVTKAGVSYPNLVKWSDIAQYDAVPGSWDETDVTLSAGENLLAEIQTQILDGMALRNAFIIYAPDQAWVMEYTGGPEIFAFYKLFNNRGIVNTNCVVEVDGLHYVFDDDDIYVHDGVSPPRSICDSRVRRQIFRYFDLEKRRFSFVHHDRSASEVWFCYKSRDTALKWQSDDCTYCNCAAVYNYAYDTWTFIDLPNVPSMTSLNWQTAPTYDELTVETYDTMSSAYSDLLANATKSNFGPSILDADLSITTTRLVNGDTGIGITLPFASVSELAVTPFVERTGLDLDELIPDLRSYKNYRSVFPQMTTDGTATLQFKFGGTDFPAQSVEYDSLQSFDPETDDRVDTRSRGRYLSWYFTATNANSYSLSGFDLDLVSVSRR